jgi:ribosomal protein S18 acetylase RimI-like enzyme
MSPPSWTLRLARPDDRDFLLGLKQATMQTSIDQVWGWDDAEQRVFFDDRFTPERWQIIQVEGEDVGVLVVDEDQEQLFLAEIELLPIWQGRGIGTSVIRSLMASSAESGKSIRLRVLHVNSRARELYERLGFRTFKEIDTHTYLCWDGQQSTQGSV